MAAIADETDGLPETLTPPRTREPDAVEAQLIERVEPVYPLGCVSGAVATENCIGCVYSNPIWASCGRTGRGDDK